MGGDRAANLKSFTRSKPAAKPPTCAHTATPPPDVGGEPRVAEEPADKTGNLVLAHRQMDQALGWVTQDLPLMFGDVLV